MSLGVVVVLAGSARSGPLAWAGAAVRAAGALEPGGDAESARLAVQEPDEYAWRLFLFINRQARTGTAGLPDPAKADLRGYDDERDVVWETWALASADGRPDGSEVFLAKGARPARWEDLPRANAAPKRLDRTFTTAGENIVAHGARVLPRFVPTEPEADEVRINRATFETIRDHELYSREGLAAVFERAVADATAQPEGNRDFIQFPPLAKEVKARWIEIEDAEKPRYHWKTIGGKTYGLAAFHVITKDLPFWFWCDFIHVDLEPQEPPGSMADATTRGPRAAHGRDGVRAETVGSKWGQYRLKGSQVAFSDGRGRPTIVGNQLIEGGKADQSSCMTCHAMAGIDKAGNAMGAGFITGLPPRSAFGDRTITRLQTDFLYSVPLRAHSRDE